MRGGNASLLSQFMLRERVREQFGFFPEQSDISFSVFEVSEKKEARRGGRNLRSQGTGTMDGSLAWRPTSCSLVVMT